MNPIHYIESLAQAYNTYKERKERKDLYKLLRESQALCQEVDDYLSQKKSQSQHTKLQNNNLESIVN